MASPKKPTPNVATRGGTRAIDVIRDSYMGERRSITVPEWKDRKTGEALTLWFGPITPSAMEKVDGRDPANNLERSLLLMVTTATDEGGKPMFEFGDIRHLKDTTEFTVLQRVFDFMLSSWLDKADAETAVKENPTSDGASSSRSDSG